MSDSPGAVWKNQPKESKAVNLEQIMNQRTEQMHTSTRAEILMSIAAAVLLVAVLAWRIAPARDPVMAAGFAAVVAWVAISAIVFRRRIWPAAIPPEALAATGVEYYRRELETRRDHLRNAWVWHGPLALACLLMVGVLARGRYAYRPLLNVAPLIVLLAAWTGFGLWRRLSQAREIERELEEMEVK